MISYALRIFLIGHVCGSFQFVMHTSVLVPAFFVVDSTIIIAQLSQNVTRSFLTV